MWGEYASPGGQPCPFGVYVQLGAPTVQIRTGRCLPTETGKMTREEEWQVRTPTEGRLEITPSTKVHDLLDEYPFLLDFLTTYRPELAKLKNPVVRNTLGRVATLEVAAREARVPAEQLVSDLRAEVERLGALREIVLSLHAGEDFETAKRRFGELAQDVDHAEIARLEQQLIREGLPESEIKRLCDVHVALFRESLDRTELKEGRAPGQDVTAGATAGVTAPTSQAPPGHPLHTLQAENAALGRIIDELRALLDKLPAADGSADGAAGSIPEDQRAALSEVFARLAQVERHYLRKENQLFPALEAHGFEGPTKVMWAVHDDIREVLKSFRTALAQSDPAALKRLGDQALTMMSDMIYKEERILFPSARDLLEEKDWIRIRQGEDDVGYAFGVVPGTEWEHSDAAQDGSEIMQQRLGAGDPGLLPQIPLDTGLLTAAQVNLLLRHLPVDVALVDENDEVRYYSEGERIFPRSPGVIGRKVQNCHPPHSVAVVQRILDEFKAGTKDVAEFWLTLNGRFVHIRYFALRDRERAYKGTLEVVQDVTGIRGLTGERRLLDW